MNKKPKFMTQLLAANKVKADVVQAKLKGESTLYMGDPTLHWGVGGWVRARANLTYGPYGSGKSSISLMACAAEQKKTGGLVVIFDSEYNHKDPHEADLDGNPTEDAVAGRIRLAKAGLDPDKVLVIKSNEVDNLFAPLKQMEEDLKDDPSCISAILVDSWGGIQAEGAKKKIAEGEIASAGNSFGGNAKTMGPILQELLRLAAESGVSMFFVQHCMKNMDMYGPPYILIGGERLKFLVHNILFVESVQAKDAALMDGEVKIGKKIRFKCEKSRNVVEGRKGEFFMDFQELKFAQPEFSLFNLATQLGIIAHPKTAVLDDEGNIKVDKEGKPMYKESTHYWEYPVGAPTPMKWHGGPGTIKALTEDKELYNKVLDDCMKTSSLGGYKSEEETAAIINNEVKNVKKSKKQA